MLGQQRKNIIIQYITREMSEAESLQNDVVAAAKALDAVAAAGGAARLEINKDGGTSLVIQVSIYIMRV